MNLTRFSVGLAVCLWACSNLALADSYGDLLKVAENVKNAHSYRTVLSMSNGRQVQMDYVAPNHFHETASDGSEMIITPDEARMKINGKWTTLPASYVKQMNDAMNKSFADTNTWLNQSDLRSQYKVLDLGMDGGFHKYEFSGKGNVGTIWVNSDGFPDHEIVTSSDKNTTTIRYTMVNQPIPFPN